MTTSVTGQPHLERIISKALAKRPLLFNEILYLLSLTDMEAIRKVMLAARKLRYMHFGNKVFLYGFIYFSTYCRNMCSFCYYRQENTLSPRYRKSIPEVLEIAVHLAESGVHLIDLTMGEDPLIHNAGNYEMLLELVRQVKEKTGLPLMISPGVVPDYVLQGFGELNVDWYALYQEVHNPILYNKLRVGQNFGERIMKRRVAKKAGILVEDGILLGVGENTTDRVNSILAMRNENSDQVRCMSLIPQAETPMAGRNTPPRIDEYLFIAVMRLVMPDRLIPASLDIDGIQGLKMRLTAGANVVTSIIPSCNNLAGVSQSSLDIEQGLRSVPEVKRILYGLALQEANPEDYSQWIATRKLQKAREELHGYRNCGEGQLQNVEAVSLPLMM